jgi:hypothetical protein
VEASDEPVDRLAALGNQLIEIHLRLRDELARLRQDVAAHLDGGPGRRPDHPGPHRQRDLTAQCLAFCSLLDRHHSGEDGGAFPVLAERHPQLRPVIDELSRDHRLVAGILRRLDELLRGLGPAAAQAGSDGAVMGGAVMGGAGVDRAGADRAGVGPERAREVRAELDGLAALLESHFGYEERKLLQALNALDAGAGTAAKLFGISPTAGG